MNHKKLEDKIADLNSKVKVIDMGLQSTIRDLITRVSNLELVKMTSHKESLVEMKLYALEDWVKDIVDLNKLKTVPDTPKVEQRACRNCGCQEFKVVKS